MPACMTTRNTPEAKRKTEKVPATKMLFSERKRLISERKRLVPEMKRLVSERKKEALKRAKPGQTSTSERER